MPSFRIANGLVGEKFKLRTDRSHHGVHNLSSDRIVEYQ